MQHCCLALTCLCTLRVGEKTGNSHNNLKHNHNQTQATPLTHRQQHPLQIVHKMPPTAGSGDHQSHHTSTASTTRQQMSIHGNEISRNQRVRKLPPGKAKGAETHDYMFTYIYMYYACTLGLIFTSVFTLHSYKTQTLS